MSEEKKVGIVFSYYNKLGVAAVKLTDGSLKTGDMIHILGNTTDFTQRLDSIQIEHSIVKEAKKGQEIGIKVSDKVRPNDMVYKVVE